MIYLGIDPGEASGALAAIDETGKLDFLIKMPTTERDILDTIQAIKPDVAAMEGLNSLPAPQAGRPGRGHKSNWSLAWNCGAVLVALHAVGCARVDRPRPQAWQKALECLTKGDKNVSKRRAQELFPSAKVTLWNCDALLLAEYARRLK